MGAAVWDYVTNTPGADHRCIVAKFGEPEKIALDYTDEMDSKEILEQIHNRSYILKVVVATALIILTIWVCVVGFAWRKHKIHDGGYIVDELTVIEETEP